MTQPVPQHPETLRYTQHHYATAIGERIFDIWPGSNRLRERGVGPTQHFRSPEELTNWLRQANSDTLLDEFTRTSPAGMLHITIREPTARNFTRMGEILIEAAEWLKEQRGKITGTANEEMTKEFFDGPGRPVRVAKGACDD